MDDYRTMPRPDLRDRCRPDPSSRSFLQGGGGGVDCLPDAPADGRLFGRRNNAWHEITGLAEDAPNDGWVYGRQNGQWVTIDISALGDVDGGVF